MCTLRRIPIPRMNECERYEWEVAALPWLHIHTQTHTANAFKLNLNRHSFLMTSFVALCFVVFAFPLLLLLRCFIVVSHTRHSHRASSVCRWMCAQNKPSLLTFEKVYAFCISRRRPKCLFNVFRHLMKEPDRPHTSDKFEEMSENCRRTQLND